MSQHGRVTRTAEEWFAQFGTALAMLSVADERARRNAVLARSLVGRKGNCLCQPTRPEGHGGRILFPAERSGGLGEPRFHLLPVVYFCYEAQSGYTPLLEVIECENPLNHEIDGLSPRELDIRLSPLGEIWIVPPSREPDAGKGADPGTCAGPGKNADADVGTARDSIRRYVARAIWESFGRKHVVRFGVPDDPQARPFQSWDVAGGKGMDEEEAPRARFVPLHQRGRIPWRTWYVHELSTAVMEQLQI
jgi:hypothetical protein